MGYAVCYVSENCCVFQPLFASTSWIVKKMFPSIFCLLIPKQKKGKKKRSLRKKRKLKKKKIKKKKKKTKKDIKEKEKEK